MSAHDEDLSAADARLAAIAGGSTISPPWRDALSALTPDSTDEERLALYKAIRDSGWLSDIEGFYLVAWQIESMAEVEAAPALQDIENRMQAISQAEGSAEDESWPDGEAPPEYEELALQSEKIWDDIYSKKLESLGEQEIADLYRTDPDEFAWRYEAGLRCFQPAEAELAESPDDLVPVDSCLDPPHADLDRAALAAAGIPVSLGNVNFVNWFWTYSNAVGGVPVYVRRGDARYASRVLSAARSRPSESLAPWTCRSCGQRIYGEWDTCWQCGKAAGSTPDERPAEQLDAPREPERDSWGPGKLSVYITAGSLAVLIVILLSGNAELALLPVPFVLACFFLLRQFELDPDPSQEQTARTGDLPPDESPARGSRVARATVRRAWQSAVFGLAFPPLGFYALSVLWKLGHRDLPLTTADQFRIWAALLLSALEVLYCLAFVGLMLFLLVHRFA